MLIASVVGSIIGIAAVAALIGSGVHKGLAALEVAALFGLAALTGSTVVSAVVGGALGYTTCHPFGLGLAPNATEATYQCHSVLWGTETERRAVKRDFFEEIVSFEEENAVAGAFYFGLAAAVASLLAGLARFVYRKTKRRSPDQPQTAAQPGPEP